jgi:hypothetical protein
MNSEQPDWFKELGQGIIDLHVHSAPCLYQRHGDEYDMSIPAKEFGYEGILFKNHLSCNAGKACIVRKILPGFKAYGSLVLSSYTGGLNPDSVEVAIKMGAKEVWMPVFHAANHIRKLGYVGLPTLKHNLEMDRPKKGWGGYRIIDQDGLILPEVEEILGLIADHDVILGTGHISVEEIYALIEAGKKIGAKKILVTHATHMTTGWTIDDQVKMADMGAMIEHCYPDKRKKEIAEAIKTIGAKRCVLATDAGTDLLPPPVTTMRLFIEEMLANGVSEKDIETMTKDNPRKLLNLD